MARKSKKASAPNGNLHSKTDLGLSDLRARLNFLEKENEKLLNQIEKKRTEFHSLTQSIEEVTLQIAQRSAPFRQKALEIDDKIHEVFKEIFNGRKLGKKSRNEIESIYRSLQSEGIISPKPTYTDEVILESNEPEENSRWGDYQERAYQDLERESPKTDREELKKIRHVFLRLAEVFHPDKVIEETQKDYRTEVMKEINQAYKNGDLARLLEIEKQQELGGIIVCSSNDDLTDQCNKVEAEYTFLKNQFSDLNQSIRITKKSRQGLIASHFKKMSKYGGDPIGDALVEIEAQISIVEKLYKFVVDLRDRRITIKEFLRGPSVFLDEDSASEQELLVELLSRYY